MQVSAMFVAAMSSLRGNAGISMPATAVSTLVVMQVSAMPVTAAFVWSCKNQSFPYQTLHIWVIMQVPFLSASARSTLLGHARISMSVSAMSLCGHADISLARISRDICGHAGIFVHVSHVSIFLKPCRHQPCRCQPCHLCVTMQASAMSGSLWPTGTGTWRATSRSPSPTWTTTTPTVHSSTWRGSWSGWRQAVHTEIAFGFCLTNLFIVDIRGLSHEIQLVYGWQ